MLIGRSGDSNLAFMMEQSRHCGRGTEDGPGDLLPQHLGTQHHIRKVGQRIRYQSDLIKRFSVAAQSNFIVSATIDIVKQRRWQPFFCKASKVKCVVAVLNIQT